MRWGLLLGLVALVIVACDDGNDGQPATCDELAGWCARCAEPGLRQSCDNAVASNDDETCRNTLHSAEVQAGCNPSASDTSGDVAGMDSSSPPDTNAPDSNSPDTMSLPDTTPGSDTGGLPDMIVLEPCEELKLMCPKCTLLNLKELCEDYISLGDPAQCISAMGDPDIQRNCL